MPIEAKTKRAQDVKYQVTRIFGDEASIQVTDKDILSFINRAQSEIVLLNYELNRASHKTTLSEGTEEIDFSSIPDLLRIVHLTFNKKLAKSISMDAALQMIGEGNNDTTDILWYAFDNKVRLVKPLAETTELEAFYNRVPTNVESLDSFLDVPDTTYNMVVNWVLKMCYELDEDQQNAQAKMQDIDRDVAAIRMDTRSQHGTPLVIRNVMGY